MVISAPSALAWHEEIIDNREDEQCQQKPVEYRSPFALEKLVCVHFPFAFSPRCENDLRTAEYSVRPSLRRGVVFMKCKADKSEHHQDGSSYHQPMRVLHRRASSSFLISSR